MARQKKEKPQEPLEKQLWAAADKLRKNIDAAEYKHVVLGLIFLRYISDSFEELYEKLKSGTPGFEYADPEDKVEYGAKNVFFVPPMARWSYLRDNAKKAEIGVMVDAALDAIEKENPQGCAAQGLCQRKPRSGKPWRIDRPRFRHCAE